MKCEKCGGNNAYPIDIGELHYALCLLCEDSMHDLIENWIKE